MVIKPARHQTPNSIVHEQYMYMYSEQAHIYLPTSALFSFRSSFSSDSFSSLVSSEGEQSSEIRLMMLWKVK